MKWLFGLLLLASLVFFAFMQWGGTWTDEGKNLQPQPVFNAEKIKLLQTAASSSVAPSPPVSLPLVVTPSVSLPAPAQSAAQSACMEWGEFSGSDLARATAVLADLKLGDKLAQRQVEHVSGYWVYIPPLPTRVEVDRKIAQLKARGVTEYFVVQEAGPAHNAISLGIFKSADAAQKFLQNLMQKGVKSARVGERMSKLSLTVFVLNNLDAGTATKVTELQKEFATSELKAVACNN